MRNVFETISECGSDEGYSPSLSDDFVPTAAAVGSRDKIDVLAERLLMGLPLWHPRDRSEFGGRPGRRPGGGTTGRANGGR